MSKPISTTKIYTYGIAIGAFVALQLGILWWKTNEKTHDAVPCDVLAGGAFQNGQRFQLIGVGDNKTPFSARITGLPENTREVYLSFQMKGMDMGFNRFDLQRQSADSWGADRIYLPLCSHQRHDWQVIWHIDGQIYQADFQTVLPKS